MNVLLIEPDKLMASAARAALELDGHAVQWRQSAQAGIDGVDHVFPDIIVLEVQLGLHNGVEFLYELRSYPEWCDIPVIVWSINQSVMGAEFARAFRQLGVVSILYKPTASLAVLRSTVLSRMSVAA